jgi:hypothetical protein
VQSGSTVDYAVVSPWHSPECSRDGARVAGDSPHGAEEGEGRMVKPFFVEAEREDVEGGLTASRSGRRCLVPVGMDRERGKSPIEGRRRCGMLWVGSGLL